MFPGTYAPIPILHNVTHRSEWPIPTQCLADALSRPLPAFATAPGPHPYYVPSKATPLLKELPQSHTEELFTEQQTEEGSATSLGDIFGLAMSTVADLRLILERKENRYSSRDTIQVWSVFMRVISLYTAESSTMLTRVPFIPPRFPPPDGVNPDRISNGIAQMIFCYVIEQFEASASEHSLVDKCSGDEPHPSPIGDVTQGSISGDNSHEPSLYLNISDRTSHDSHHGTECESSTTTNSTDNSGFGFKENSGHDTADTDSTDSESILSSIGIPFDAHVIGGRGRRTDVVVPTFCVADEINIIPLLTSVLYQRSVLGIPELTVGLCLSSGGLDGRIFIGWVDEISDSEHIVPQSHVAGPISCSETSSTVGVFNLSDPGSFLRLAQFILNLRSHFCSIRRACENPCVKPIGWRCDYLDSDTRYQTIPGEEEERRGRIERWLGEVEGPQTSSFSMPKAKKAQDTLQDKGKAASSTGSKNEAQSQLTVPTGAQDGSSVSQKKSVSCSNFAKTQGGSAGAEKSTTLTWTIDRQVIPLACIEVHPSTGIREAGTINEKVEYYKKMTEFAWPKAWDEKYVMEKDFGNSGLTKIWRELYQAYETHAAAEAEKRNAWLEPDMADILDNQLSYLLSDTQMASITKKSGGKGIEIPEAESRRTWDSMLLHFYVEPTQRFAEHVLTESEINLSRNMAYDGMQCLDEERMRYALNCFVDERSNHGVAQYNILRPLRDSLGVEVGSKDVQALKDAMLHAYSDELALSTLLKDKKRPLKEVFKKRRDEEPRRAICDAVIVRPVFDVLYDAGKSMDQDNRNRITSGMFIRRPTLFSDPEPALDMSYPIFSLPSMIKDPAFHKLVVSLSKPHSKSDELTIPVPTLDSDAVVHKFTSMSIADHSESNSSESELWIKRGTVLLPQLVVEYKKSNHTPFRAQNQGKMYCISAVDFLGELGMVEQPVFSLVTNGTSGELMMAWRMGKGKGTSKKAYILETIITKYDISKSIDAYKFALFLLRLQKDGRKLEQAFTTQARSELRKQFDNRKLPSWTLSAQAHALGWTPKKNSNEVAKFDYKDKDSYKFDGEFWPMGKRG